MYAQLVLKGLTKNNYISKQDLYTRQVISFLTGTASYKIKLRHQKTLIEIVSKKFDYRYGNQFTDCFTYNQQNCGKKAADQSKTF